MRFGSPAIALRAAMWASAASVSIVCSPVHADQPFYRCVVNGKTTYMDKPCDAPGLPGVTGPSTSAGGQALPGKPTKSIDLDYTTPYGVWRGQAQYQAFLMKRLQNVADPSIKADSDVSS